jgi:hypothetical protein
MTDRLTQEELETIRAENMVRMNRLARAEAPLSEIRAQTINEDRTVTPVIAQSPLKALDTSKYAYTALQYPFDAGSYAKGHTVVFNISDIEPASVEKVEKFLGDTVTSGAKVAKEEYEAATAGNPVEYATNKLQEGLARVYNEVKTLTEEVGKNGVINTLNSGAKKVESFFKPQFTKSVAGIRLCMPDTVNFQYAVQYDKLSLANAYGAVPLAGRIVKGITSTLDNNPAARMLMNANGMAFNPQMQVLFDGIDFREYEMTFVFTPNNAREAETVKQIIKTFRKYSAPTVMKQTGGFFFNPPSVVDVQFMFNGRPNPYLNEIRRSVITQVTVDYSPNQTWATFGNGAPVQTSMTLSFREIYLVDRDSIDGEA